jgi:hypothetical protein
VISTSDRDLQHPVFQVLQADCRKDEFPSFESTGTEASNQHFVDRCRLD